MNLDELVAQYRFESSDDIAPLITTDEQVESLFNGAVEEACRRKKLIFDVSTAAVCNVSVTAGVATYPLHGSIVAVFKAYLDDGNGNILYLDILSRDELDRVNPAWREDTEDPAYLIVDGTTLQITPAPASANTLKLEVQRTPIVPMSSGMVSPEIATKHHRFLVFWVLHKVYGKPDPDFENPKLAQVFEQKFNDYFGQPSDADRPQIRREDMPIRNNVTL